MSRRNPQAEQMRDESMVRTLDAQVRCLWPQERHLLERYGSPIRILDVGCGTGVFTERLATHYPQASIFGIDIDPGLVEHARQRCAQHGARVEIAQGDAFELPAPAESADLIVCRHLLQAIPEPEQVIAQCRRVLRPGGWLHLVLEDYTMIHIEGPTDFDRFWHQGPVRFGAHTGCDNRIGRRGISLLEGFMARQLDFISVDTERVSRGDFADVFSAWRDGYSEALSTHLGCSVEEVIATWDAMLAVIRTGYALWQVPVASGQRT